MGNSFFDEDDMEGMGEVLANFENVGNNDDSVIEKKIPFELIYRNDFNRDANVEIEELAENIKALNVLLHNLVVKDDGKGRYMLLSGERRWRALSHIKETDPDYFNKQYKELVCKVVGKNIDELKLRVMARSANRVVPPTPEEEAKDLEEIRILHAKKVANGDDVDQNFFSYVAGLQNTNKRQLQKVVAITDYLIPELKEWFYAGAFDTNTGAAIAHYDDSVQKEALRYLSNPGDKLSKKQVEDLKGLNEALKEEYKESLEGAMKAKIVLKDAKVKEMAGLELTDEEKEKVQEANATIKKAAKELAESVKEIKKAKKKENSAIPKTSIMIGGIEKAVAELKKQELSAAEKNKVKELIEELNKLL